jgi:hypothetical protein
MTNLKISSRLSTIAAFSMALFVSPATFAGDWGVHLSPGGWGFHYGDRDSHISIDTGPPVYYRPQPYPYPYRPLVTQPRRYYPSGPYYPSYNPVVRRDVEQGGVIAPDGTAHSETRVEDRHASYYSPGRNEAVTAPQTSVTRRLGPDGVWREIEHTRWIGADGKPHSTTVERDTVQDIWGNTHTDTNITLKSVKPGNSTGTSSDKQPPPVQKEDTSGGKGKN